MRAVVDLAPRLKDIDAALSSVGRPVELSSLDEMAGFMGAR